MLLLLLGVAIGWAADAPAIRREGVVNAASQRPAPAGGAIAPGSLVTIHGVRFAKGQEVLLRTARGKRLRLPIVSVDWQRLEAYLPPTAPVGPAKLTVAGTQKSEAFDLTIQPSAFGLFSVNGQGWGPAAPGTPGILLANGATRTPEIFVGGEPARVLRVRAQPDHRTRIEIEIPMRAPEGCHVPVYGRLGGATSNTVTMAVRRDPLECAAKPEWLSPGRTAIFAVSRAVRTELESRGETRRDEASALFLQVRGPMPACRPILLNPPAGACATFSEQMSPNSSLADSLESALTSCPDVDLAPPRGPVVIQDGRQRAQLGTVVSSGGYYRRLLDGRSPQAPFSGLTTMADGGSLGPVRVPPPAAFASVETRRTTVESGQPLPLHWQAFEGPMRILLLSAIPSGAAGMVYCTASGAAGQFTIPAALSSHLPHGRGLLTLARVREAEPPSDPVGYDAVKVYSAFLHEIEVRIQ